MTPVSCDLNLTEDQRQIIDAAASLLETSFPVSRPAGADRDRLADIAAFGAFALALDEEQGGAGFTLVEEALLHVLFGRHLVPTTALAAPIAVRLALSVGDIALAERLTSGERLACAAIAVGEELRLVDGDGADLAVCIDNGRLDLVDLRGLAGTMIPALGRRLDLSRIRRDATRIVATSDKPALVQVVDLLVSAQLLGIAKACLDLAVAYAKVRHQFGKPIGSFQAIKHHCANMAISAELLSAQLDMAAIALRDAREDAGFQVAAARLLAPQAALDNARLCIQVHGGIGFSAEAEPHRYLKQAHVLRQLGGGASMLDHPSPMAPHRSDRGDR